MRDRGRPWSFVLNVIICHKQIFLRYKCVNSCPSLCINTLLHLDNFFSLFIMGQMKILINLCNLYIFEAAFNKQFANLVKFLVYLNCNTILIFSYKAFFNTTLFISLLTGCIKKFSPHRGNKYTQTKVQFSLIS